MIATTETPCLEPVTQDGRSFEWGEGVPHWKTETEATENITAIAQAYTDDDREPPTLTPKRMERPCWHLTCDECGYRFDEEEWVTHFADRSEVDALFLADYDWTEQGERHLCSACRNDFTDHARTSAPPDLRTHIHPTITYAPQENA